MSIGQFKMPDGQFQNLTAPFQIQNRKLLIESDAQKTKSKTLKDKLVTGKHQKIEN